MQSNIRQSATRKVEIKLGATHITILLGLVLGTMAGAFYLGFSSGRTVGYDHALAVTLANAARVPIPVDERDSELSDEVTSEVYAKLAAPVAGRLDDLRDPKSLAKNEDGVPQLGAIPSTDELPILPEEVLPLGSGSHKSEGQVGKIANLNVEAGIKSHEEKIELRQEVAAPNIPVKEDVAKLSASSKVEEVIEGKPLAKETRDLARVKISEPVDLVEPVKESAKSAVKTQLSNQEPEKLSKGWYVQVAAPESSAEAGKLAAQLKKGGFKVAIETVEIKGRRYNRVNVGPSKDRSLAEKLAIDVKKTGIGGGEPFIRSVR